MKNEFKKARQPFLFSSLLMLMFVTCQNHSHPKAEVVMARIQPVDWTEFYNSLELAAEKDSALYASAKRMRQQAKAPILVQEHADNIIQIIDY